MVEMEADTPAAASSDDAPRSAPGGSADAPVEAEGSAPAEDLDVYHAMDGSLSFLTHNPTSCLLFES